MSHKILVLPGDHVGPEVVDEALKVLKVVEEKSKVQFEFTFDLCGGCSIDKHGTAITEQVLGLAEKSDAILFGSAGGPEWYVTRERSRSKVLFIDRGRDEMMLPLMQTSQGHSVPESRVWPTKDA